MLLLDESPSIFAHICIYGHKDDSPLPPLNHLFFPAACTAVGSSYVPSVVHEFYIGQSPSTSASYKTTLRKQALRKPEIATGSHYSRSGLVLLSQNFFNHF